MEVAPRHRVLVFVPEGDRTSNTIPVDLADKWTVRLLKLFARLFGGATAYGRGVGVWRSDNRTHWDRVTVIESWFDPAMPEHLKERRLDRMGRELSAMCAALNQEIVGCIIDGRWYIYEAKNRS